ncbi:MFS transporter [Microbacterium sp. zg.Y1090]|uniref:MFS transporter n=1 Tax=Microbacterium TaxID=33882 RepID=UPI00214AD258|nr:MULTISPECIES: MFS transporter [unclassified Microbacterium]MCR2813938.1 MFS transporter [Microbacterium sp. zg.Y1084]MCR2819212.1 MFS transporter [Microbacterium sp. zg.Y1090]MDL5487121.1 MFS transporter [Microbacterium sp. zg-Y1211]WIM28196.1 MFS transporter [Microbacterium sp. zg-Y1090]
MTTSPGEARHLPATADTDALPVMGLDLRRDSPAPRKTVLAWALWDWAAQPFNTVILTFIFTALYLTTDVFLPAEVAALPDGDRVKEVAEAGLAAGLGWGTTIAGLLILALAPVLGQQADAAGRQKLWLGIGTGGLVMSMALLWFVEPAPALFWLGVALISAGTVFSEIAGVNYNAMLIGIATPRTIGRISGLGWGFGYLGGIVALILVVVFYMSDWFGLSEDGGLPFRIIAVGCALWTVAFAIPIFLRVPEPSLGRPERRVGLLRGYGLLVRDVIDLYRTPQSRPTFWFLLSSAVFRDGLSGVFTFGAIIAGRVYGFEFLDLVIFGIAANLIAGVSTLIVGRWDDRFGPKTVILWSLTVMVVLATAVFALVDAGPIVFWVGGLALCACVGPAQAASRSFLARLTPAGREGEIFGLYATTGRAAGWMTSLLWAVLISLTGATAFGILGIAVVLLAGLLLLLPVAAPARVR